LAGRSAGGSTPTSATLPAPGPPLPRAFFARPTQAVALDLLGAYLVHERPDGRLVGRIVETEAYVGLSDRASHASRGRTRRTDVMFGPPGYAYVYLVYGMYYCLNAVTEAEDYPAAVLIRALEPCAGIDAPSSGPGRLCRALGIDRRHDRADLTAPPLYLAAGERPTARVVAGPRVGVPYAGPWALKPWRFYLRDSPWVSRRPRPRARRRG
jgi:DNA-3-methyladenine glycosylase